MTDKFQASLNKALAEKTLLKEDIINLLSTKSSAEEKQLFDLADQIRRKHHGNVVHLRGIIEFSSYCRNDCQYCGLRCSNKEIARYRMTVAEVIECAKDAVNMGLHTIVLQSGEDLKYQVEDLCQMVRGIKNLGDIAITLSVGLRSKEDYLKLYQAGADRFLLKHETADENLFNTLRPGTYFKERLQCLNWLREIGYQVGSGNMVGLPGQTMETLAEDLLLLKEIDVEMAGIGPFIPHPQTPLKDAKPGDITLSMKTLAVARILLPLAHLPATTAAGTIHAAGRLMALQCGANVIMPNVTPLVYRKQYQIYPNKNGLNSTPEESINNIIQLIKEASLEVGINRGDSPKMR